MSKAIKKIVRFTGDQHKLLKDHLLPPDGNEAIAFALCGRHIDSNVSILTVQEIFLVPYADCIREEYFLEWPSAFTSPILNKTRSTNLAVLKIHSHPGGFSQFSRADDKSDKEFFEAVYNWADKPEPHASLVMLPEGKLFGRFVNAQLEFEQIDQISIAGNDINFFFSDNSNDSEEVKFKDFDKKNALAFGSDTVKLLKKLCIGIIGCSGTGSPTIEQLMRLGVGKLVLVDPDFIEEKNLNRIINTKLKHTLQKTNKVKVFEEIIKDTGIGNEVEIFESDIYNSTVVKALAKCDVIFGCIDTIEGRFNLNKLTTFYNIPYFDIGVNIDANKETFEIEDISGAVNYFQPGKSSFVSRNMFTPDDVVAEGRKRKNPESYEKDKIAGYLKDFGEESPAVISLNMLASSLAVNEFMARIHKYKFNENSEFDFYCFNLTQSRLVKQSYPDDCSIMKKYLGKGDIEPLINNPEVL